MKEKLKKEKSKFCKEKCKMSKVFDFNQNKHIIMKIETYQSR